MTRKHFKLIAETISNFEPPFTYRNVTIEDDEWQTAHTRLALAEVFADVLKNENPNFDKERFMRACGVVIL